MITIAGRPVSLRLYSLATRLAAPLAAGLLRARARAGKEDIGRLDERLGRAGMPRPAGRLVWLHGVSVGESLSLLSLVERLSAERPEIVVLVTSATRTSGELLASRIGAGVVHQYAPVDTPAAVARFLDHWRPDVGVFVENELWPNLILTAKTRKIRLALVSARLSARSFRGWRRAPAAARAVLGAFDLILARDEAAARRFVALGMDVHGLADLKFGAAPLPVDEAELASLRMAVGRRTVLVAASTHPGEETIILQASLAARPSIGAALLIIVPRHADRGAEIKRQVRAVGLRSERRAAGSDPAKLDVWVADTLGELGLWFRLADLAVMGGSLVAGVGGHNPLEPARLGCPFVSGPHVENWPVYAELEGQGATLLVREAPTLFTLGEENAVMARRAAAFVEERDREAYAVAGRLLALLAP